MDFLAKVRGKWGTNAEKGGRRSFPGDRNRKSNGSLPSGHSDEQELVSDAIDVLFVYVGVVAVFVFAAEIFAIFILKHAKVFHQIRSFSASFLLADALFQVVSVIYAFLRMLFYEDFENTLAMFRQFGQGVTSCIIFSSVAIMSWDRVIAMAWPLKYKAFVNPTRIKYIIAVNWFLNTVFYTFSVAMYYRACSNSDNGCEQVSKSELFPNETFLTNREFIAENEHAALTIMLTTYEILNIIACCILTYQIRCHFKRQMEKRELFRKRICSKDSTVSKATLRSTSTSVSILSMSDRSNHRTKNMSVDQKVGSNVSVDSNNELSITLFKINESDASLLSVDQKVGSNVSVDSNNELNITLSKINESDARMLSVDQKVGSNVSVDSNNELSITPSKINESDARMFISDNDLVSDTEVSAKLSRDSTGIPIQDQILSAKPLPQIPSISHRGLQSNTKPSYTRTTTTAVTKVILIVAVLQFFFHVPHILTHIALIFQGRGRREVWNILFEVLSKAFLQIGSIPSLYLYVLKLKECQRLIKQKVWCFKTIF